MTKNINNHVAAGTPAAPIAGTPAPVAVQLTGSAPPAGGGGNSGGNPGGGAVNGGTLFGAVPAQAVLPDHAFRAELEQIDDAVQKLIPSGAIIPIGGQSPTREQVLAQLQPTLDLFTAVDAQVRATKLARLNLKGALPAAHQLVKSLKAALVNLLGPGNPELVSFGIKTGHKKALTAEQKFLRAQKATKTRKVRGTLGSRQKQDVKFTGQLEAQAVESSGNQGSGGDTTPAAGATGGDTTGNGGNTAPTGNGGTGNTPPAR